VKLKFNAPFSTAIAIGVGLVVLFGYFFGANAAGKLTLLGVLREYFLQGAVILTAVAILVGIVNLASVHVRKIKDGEGEGYSFVLILSLIITLGLGFFEMIMTYSQGEPNLQRIRWLFENVQLPIEASLMAVLAISLTYAAARLLRQRMNLLSAVFVAVVLLILVGTVPLIASRFPIIGEIKTWIVQVPAVGGARGILLGVALGTIATGLRILMGSDRPYGG
jgi:cytochrome bd-type quinol oxidase subunit 2